MNKLKIRKELIKYKENLIKLKKISVINENEKKNQLRDIEIVQNKIKKLKLSLNNEMEEI